MPGGQPTAAKIGRLARRTQEYAKSAEQLLLVYAAALPLANWALKANASLC